MSECLELCVILKPMHKFLLFLLVVFEVNSWYVDGCLIK